MTYRSKWKNIVHAVLTNSPGRIICKEKVHQQRQHRQDDADGRGQLEFAFEEHLISLLSAPNPAELIQRQRFGQINQAYLRCPATSRTSNARLIFEEYMFSP